MKEATVYQRTLWEQASAEDVAAVKAAGGTVIPAQKELFQQSVQALIEAQTKTELGPIIKKIRDTE